MGSVDVGATRRPVLAAFVLGLLWALAIVAQADASSFAAGPYVDSIGPKFNGKRLVWLQTQQDGGLDLRRVLPGQRARPSTLFRFPPTERDFRSVVLVASPKLVVARVAKYYPGKDLLESRTEPLGTIVVYRGQVRRLDALCAAQRLPCYSGGITTDDDQVVVSDPNSGTATMIDMASGHQTQAPVAGSQVPGRGVPSVVAGRYVAWAADRQVVVYDHVSGREAYRVGGLGVGDGPWALQRDGTVILGLVFRGQQRLAWASRASPTVHRLRVRPTLRYTTFSRVSVVDDRVVFARRDDDADPEVGVIGLRGRGRVVARTAAGLAFDGRRLAWAQRTCAGLRMMVEDVDALVRRPRVDPPRCRRLRLTEPVRYEGLPLAYGHRLVVRASCAGFTSNCSARGLTVRTTRAHRVGGRRIPRGTDLVKRYGGYPTTIQGGSPYGHVTLNPVGGRLLRSRSQVRLRISGRFHDVENRLWGSPRSVVVTARGGG